MKRILVSVGTWASVVFVAGICLATDPRKPANQPVAPASPQPAASGGAGGGFRYAAPANSGGNGASAYQRAAAARRAANSAAAARSAAANAQQNSNSYYSSYGYSPNGYSPYGYSPYGYPYSPYGSFPPGTSPYVLGYDPSTGTMFLYPYGGSGYSSYYPQNGYPYAYSNRYSYYRNPYLGYGYPSAVFANAGQLYGLGPIQQLMGVDQWFQPPQANANGFANAQLANANGNRFANGNANGDAGNANPGLANNGNAVAHQDADPPAHKPAAAGGMALEIAWKFITFGDAHFGNQKYGDALDRYRRAARECPALADAWFREGFALAALGRYDQAAKAMRRGLEEKPDWVDNNFRLSELYGDNGDDKKALLDKMLKAAEAEPTNADLAYVVGVHLYCDGRVDQSAPFFHRAAQILNSDADVKPFLAKGQ